MPKRTRFGNIAAVGGAMAKWAGKKASKLFSKATGTSLIANPKNTLPIAMSQIPPKLGTYLPQRRNK